MRRRRRGGSDGAFVRAGPYGPWFFDAPGRTLRFGARHGRFEHAPSVGRPMTQPPGPGNGLRDTFRTLGGLGTVGLSFVFAIFIGVAAGYFLMTKFGLGRWVFFLFFIFGVAAGVLNVYRTAGRFLK